VVTEDWLEFILRRGEELARRLVVTPTPPRTAAGRRDLDANLYAPQLALERVTSVPLASEDSQIGVGMRVCLYGQDRTYPGSS
jgi:hypothetical protein